MEVRGVVLEKMPEKKNSEKIRGRTVEQGGNWTNTHSH